MDEWGTGAPAPEEAKEKDAQAGTVAVPAPSASTRSDPGGWWGWISKTSENVVNIAKSELTEFKNQIADDTRQAASEAAKQDGVKKVAAGLSSILGMSEPKPAQSTPKPQRTTQEIIVSRREASIRQLQEDERTYLTDIRTSDAPRFEEWQRSFDLSTRTDDISVVLSGNPKVRAIHSAAVPEKVSYAVFWKRYFFRLELLLENEQRRAAVLAWAAEKKEEEEPSWDDDEALDKELAERSKNLSTDSISSSPPSAGLATPAPSPSPSTVAAAPSVPKIASRTKIASVKEDEDKFDWGNDDDDDAPQDVGNATPAAAPAAQPTAKPAAASAAPAPPVSPIATLKSPDGSFVAACAATPTQEPVTPTLLPASPLSLPTTPSSVASSSSVLSSPAPASTLATPTPIAPAAASAPTPPPAATPKANFDWDAWE